MKKNSSYLYRICNYPELRGFIKTVMNVCIGEQFFRVTVKERAERESYMSKKLFLEAMIKFFLGVVLVGTLIFLLYPFLIVKRLKEEEVFLEKNLPGYKEYRKKVKYRLIPFLW